MQHPRNPSLLKSSLGASHSPANEGLKETRDPLLSFSATHPPLLHFTLWPLSFFFFPPGTFPSPFHGLFSPTFHLGSLPSSVRKLDSRDGEAVKEPMQP